MAQSRTRPTSPFLFKRGITPLYVWGVHMTVSILNRMMGVGLATVGMLGLVWWLIAAATGVEAYDYFMSWATSWLGYGVAVAMTFVFFFHLCAGLRHFVMDAGAGFELKTNRAWAWGTIVGAVFFTGLAWLLIFWKGF